MDQQANNSYLESQVLTATPQKLRLMLIDAAISSARRAVAHWQSEHNERALEELAQSRNIVSELLAGIKPDETELTQRVMAVYLFLFKTITEAQLRRDPTLIEETIRVLQVERETWQLVCEQMPDAPAPLETVLQPAEITANHSAISADQSASPAGGFVMDA